MVAFSDEPHPGVGARSGLLHMPQRCLPVAERTDEAGNACRNCGSMFDVSHVDDDLGNCNL